MSGCNEKNKAIDHTIYIYIYMLYAYEFVVLLIFFYLIIFRMNNTCVILVLFFAFVSCTFSSYLDIPPPPERPMRFKTKEQIENYLKAVKDYYDAFKIKLVRRQNSLADHYSKWEKSSISDDDDDDDDDNNNNEEFNEQLHLFQKLYNLYKRNELSRNSNKRSVLSDEIQE